MSRKNACLYGSLPIFDHCSSAVRHASRRVRIVAWRYKIRLIVISISNNITVGAVFISIAMDIVAIMASAVRVVGTIIVTVDSTRGLRRSICRLEVRFASITIDVAADGADAMRHLADTSETVAGTDGYFVIELTYRSRLENDVRRLTVMSRFTLSYKYVLLFFRKKARQLWCIG